MTLYISESAQNWEAVDSSFSEVGRKHYYINVCHKVWKRGGAFSCSDGAAICSVGESGIFVGGVSGDFLVVFLKPLKAWHFLSKWSWLS